MDHYCPWTNNAIGATNQKMFILFVIYTDVAAMYYYYLLGIIMVSTIDVLIRGGVVLCLNVLRWCWWLLLFVL